MSSYNAVQDSDMVSPYGEAGRQYSRSGYNTLIALFAGTVLGSIGTFLLEAAYIAAIR